MSKIEKFVAMTSLAGTLALPVQLVAQQTNGQIAFAQQIGPGGQGANVFIANPDGTHIQQVPLVNLAEDFGVPIWSPEGTKLLISHTVRLDGAGQCCLFQPATVNPDGTSFNQLDPPSPPGASSDGMDCGAWVSGRHSTPLRIWRRRPAGRIQHSRFRWRRSSPANNVSFWTKLQWVRHCGRHLARWQTFRLLAL